MEIFGFGFAEKGIVKVWVFVLIVVYRSVI